MCDDEAASVMSLLLPMKPSSFGYDDRELGGYLNRLFAIFIIKTASKYSAVDFSAKKYTKDHLTHEIEDLFQYYDVVLLPRPRIFPTTGMKILYCRILSMGT